VSRKISFIALAAILGAAAGALRLLAVPPTLPDLDSVNFASSLSRFDLAAQAPHFPGYPLYVLSARAFRALGFGEIHALALPGIVLAVAAVVSLAWVASRAGTGAGLGAAALFGFAPVAILAGGSPTSDGAGVAALALVLALHAGRGAGETPRGAVALGIAAALAIGIRPSLAPAVALLWAAIPAGRRLAGIAGAATGCAAWLLPMVALAGVGPFGAVASAFLAGHGGSWGGTVLSRPDLGERLHAFGFDLFAANLALPWPGLWTAGRLLVAAGAVALVTGVVRSKPAASPGDGAALDRRMLAVALLSAIAYGLWAFVGQNLDKPRHLLPLVPAVALGAAALLGSLRASWKAPALATLGAGLLVTAIPLALHQGRESAPGAAMALGLRDRLSPMGVMIFTGQEGKLVERYAPEFRAGRVPDPARLEAEASRLATAGVDVYVTSAAPGASLLAGELEPVERFGSCPRGVLTGCELVLYRFHPAKGSL